MTIKYCKTGKFRDRLISRNRVNLWIEEIPEFFATGKFHESVEIREIFLHTNISCFTVSGWLHKGIRKLHLSQPTNQHRTIWAVTSTAEWADCLWECKNVSVWSNYDYIGPNLFTKFCTQMRSYRKTCIISMNWITMGLIQLHRKMFEL